MNLIVTCARHLEPEAADELMKNLALFGDETPEIQKTELSGVLTAKTELDPVEFIRKIQEKIDDEPWSIRYCLRIIPIQKVADSNLDEITTNVLSLMNNVKKNETFRITIEKRNSNISSTEIISKVAQKIPNKVSLEEPDWIILIEILGDSYRSFSHKKR